MRRKQKSASGSLLELVFIVAVALGLALGIQAFIVKPYRIPSGSMEPTLAVGERVLVNRIGNNFGDPKVGDILVFHPPRGRGHERVRRPGQGPFYDGPQSRIPARSRRPIAPIRTSSSASSPVPATASRSATGVSC